jgi:hypothetical protein
VVSAVCPAVVLLSRVNPKPGHTDHSQVAHSVEVAPVHIRPPQAPELSKTSGQSDAFRERPLSQETLRFCRLLHEYQDPPTSEQRFESASAMVLSQIGERLSDDDRKLLSRDGAILASQSSGLFSDDLSDMTSDRTSAFTRTVAGLRFAGFIDQQPGGKWPEDLNAASSVFAELSKANPENAAYILFELAIAVKMGRSDRVIRLISERLEGARTYDSEFSSYFKRLRQAAIGSGDPVAFLETEIYLTDAVIPNYTFMDSVKARLSQVYPEALQRLGDLMVRQATEGTISYIDFGYSPIEFFIGRKIASTTLPELKLFDAGKVKLISEQDEIQTDSDKCNDQTVERMKEKLARLATR